ISYSIVKIEPQETPWKMGQERFRSAGGFSVSVIALLCFEVWILLFCDLFQPQRASDDLLLYYSDQYSTSWGWKKTFN
ncbi:MAG TPA: hypothetical protein VE548_04270, partial [Nitrososphaeraceae archaeon]|nr:hypothetical protein [Nitrososphaeraceae archaeon]